MNRVSLYSFVFVHTDQTGDRIVPHAVLPVLSIAQGFVPQTIVITRWTVREHVINRIVHIVLYVPSEKKINK